ncbi:MAG: methyltransferase domain-containing protein, partial [Chloroflexi bacterium]|nr:methyltransferase domain-containing protein [Chloroflexota bacterium]
MVAGGSDHKETVRSEFTRAAAAFAASANIADPAGVARLIEAVKPGADARVLEVACGPGYVAVGFATACREVVALDLTPALLEIGEARRRERGLDNLRFQ